MMTRGEMFVARPHCVQKPPREQASRCAGREPRESRQPCKRSADLLAHKLLEICLLTFGLAPTPVSEPFLGGRKAVPTWNACSQVYRLPKRVTRRFVELAELREECIDEFCSPLVSRRAFLPIEIGRAHV